MLELLANFGSDSYTIMLMVSEIPQGVLVNDPQLRVRGFHSHPRTCDLHQ
jgi:hypothetical protein